ncbi:TPA: hypothetical protein DDW35_11995 [Candidatus Sumerlaeota bacterium]|nr:hypothetical protein [Candidatus Sumerlaeota bacterium]
MKNILCLCALLALLVTTSACSRTAPTAFYQITPIAQAKPIEHPATPQQRIGLLPVSVAAYLDRSQIITRTDPNTVVPANFHVWAEPLRENLRAVLLDNLSNLRPADTIFLCPDSKQDNYTKQVTVRVTRCEGAPNDQAVLAASWEVYSVTQRQVVATQSVTLHAPVQGASHTELAAALSRLTGELSQAIAKSLDETPKP